MTRFELVTYGLRNRCSTKIAQLRKSFGLIQLAISQTIVADWSDLHFAYLYAPKRNY